MLEKMKKGLEKVKNYWDDEIMGYHYERIENWRVDKNSVAERMNFDTIVKVDKFGKTHERSIVPVGWGQI